MSETQRLIKKYPNRRLYDTATSKYVTLTDIKSLVMEEVQFRVVDVKTNEDLTRSILLQIILEEESCGSPMFSRDVLAQIIRYYGHALQGMMGAYLEKNIQTFIEMQQRFQDQSKRLYGTDILNADAWRQFISLQGPTVQRLMGSYLEQSAAMFLEMQQRLQDQTKNLFTGFQSPPNSAARDAAMEDSTAPTPKNPSPGKAGRGRKSAA